MTDLAQSITVAGLHIRNRLVMPPMVRNLATEEGHVTEELVEHYRARSRGEVGLIIVEAAGIALEHRIMKQNIGIHNDSMIPGLRSLAKGIKDHGAAAFIQINHCGPKTHLKTRYVGPSDIPVMKHKPPEALTVDEIDEITELFAQAARRAKEAGFDGVEIHGAHFYLLSAFLSGYTNRRDDEYGGSIKNRTRFSVEVVSRIRETVGDFPLIFRMNGFENIVGGITMEEGIEIARIMERAGVDIIHPSCVVDATYNPGIPHIFDEENAPKFLKDYPYDSCIPIAEQIKPNVQVPVIGVGMVRDAAYAREVMRRNSFDFLAIGRGLLADPDFARKTLTNMDSDVIPWKE